MIKISNYEDAKIHVIEYKSKFSGCEQLKAADFSRNHGRFIDLDASDYEDRMKMKETMPKYHRHQLVHNFSASKINDGMHSVACNAKFCHNVLIFFPTDTVMQLCVLLMKEMNEKYFK